MQPWGLSRRQGQKRLSALILLALALSSCALAGTRLCVISSPSGVVAAYIGDCERKE